MHSKPNAELQNVRTTQLTILNVTNFQLEFQIVDCPLRKYTAHQNLMK